MRWKLNNSAYKRVPSREAAMDYGDLETPAKVNDGGGAGPSWRRSLPHVCVATLTSFLFGYHSGVVNEPLESISTDLGFSGNTLAEGLVVSICLGGAFIGCLFSGSVADGIGRRRGFQLSALPMILGAAIRSNNSCLPFSFPENTAGAPKRQLYEFLLLHNLKFRI